MNVDDLLKRLGNAIRNRREALGVSQEAFGDRIKVNRAYYGDLERGARNPTVQSLDRVAKGLGTTIAALFAEAEHDVSGQKHGARRTHAK